MRKLMARRQRSVVPGYRPTLDWRADMWVRVAAEDGRRGVVEGVWPETELVLERERRKDRRGQW